MAGLILPAIVLVLFPSYALAATAPRVILILDDVGYRYSDHRALQLPTEVTFAILPDAPLTEQMSELAHAQGRDVMLHMPMEANDGTEMGPDGLKVSMYSNTIATAFDQALNSVPYAIGVNNHMGSKFTSDADQMAKFMALVKARNLFFIDSRTSTHTVAEKLARKTGVPTARRHVFIDHDPSWTAMEHEFERLVKVAQAQGTAVGIAHPHPATLRFLAAKLPLLQELGVELAPVSKMFAPANSMMAGQPLSADIPVAPN